MSRPKRDDEQSTLRPAWLLRHAAQLLERVSDTDLPRTANPRRAVSAAYYAVFHKVCPEVAYTAFPRADPTVWWQLCRGFTHKGIADIAVWVNGAAAPRSVAALVDLARDSTNLTRFATVFVVLREERERADYSHEVVIDRPSALALVNDASAAIAALDQLAYDDSAWRAFVVLMLMKSQTRSYALPGERGT